MATQLVEDRETALRVGYKATDWSSPIAFENYCELVKDWTVTALKRGDDVIGAAYKKGDELHISVLPEWRKKWFSKSLWRDFFQSGRVTTKVTPGHDYMYSILKRLGFKESDNGLWIKEN